MKKRYSSADIHRALFPAGPPQVDTESLEYADAARDAYARNRFGVAVALSLEAVLVRSLALTREPGVSIALGKESEIIERACEGTRLSDFYRSQLPEMERVLEARHGGRHPTSEDAWLAVETMEQFLRCTAQALVIASDDPGKVSPKPKTRKRAKKAARSKKVVRTLAKAHRPRRAT